MCPSLVHCRPSLQTLYTSVHHSYTAGLPLRILRAAMISSQITSSAAFKSFTHDSINGVHCRPPPAHFARCHDLLSDHIWCCSLQIFNTCVTFTGLDVTCVCTCVTFTVLDVTCVCHLHCRPPPAHLACCHDLLADYICCGKFQLVSECVSDAPQASPCASHALP